ncbi:MAG: hypothetical protein OXF79_21720 [Chloroflexi bacterium]|nr:hypothetical protein [Chloroflexota bacterium]
MSIADVSPIAMFPDRLPGNLWNFDMTKSNVAALFDCLDAWRNLPAYQLERRADIFFGLFLPLALDHYLKPRDISVDPRIIPEFPLGQSDTNRSDKADFFAVSRDRERAFLIELKTDMGSLRDSQEDYLNRAVARGLDAVLCDIRSIAKARNPRVRRKYYHLLRAIAALDLMTLPPDLERRIYDDSHGVYDCINRIRIPSALPDIEVIHVLPGSRKAMQCIDFKSFAIAVEEQGEIGERFAASLRTWAGVEAGNKGPTAASGR